MPKRTRTRHNKRERNASLRTVLLLPDSKDWAFHHIAQNVQRHCELHHSDRLRVLTAFYPEFLARFVTERNEPRDGYELPSFELSEIDTVVCFWYGQAYQIFDCFPDRVVKIVCVYDYVRWPSSSVLAEPVYHTHLDRALQRATYALYACPAIREQLISSFPRFDERKLHPCTDGVDLSVFTPREDPREDDDGGRDGAEGSATEASRRPPLRIGWAGNSHFHGGCKGVPLIEQVAQENSDWLSLRVQDSSVNRLRHDEMPSFYHNIDVYVCMSIAEGTPNPILEAAACGKPFVSTDVGIVPCLLSDAESLDMNAPPGISLPERSAEALEAALRTLYDQPTGRTKEMGCVARRVLEEKAWDWSDRAKQFADVFMQ